MAFEKNEELVSEARELTDLLKEYLEQDGGGNGGGGNGSGGGGNGNGSGGGGNGGGNGSGGNGGSGGEDSEQQSGSGRLLLLGLTVAGLGYLYSRDDS